MTPKGSINRGKTEAGGHLIKRRSVSDEASYKTPIEWLRQYDTVTTPPKVVRHISHYCRSSNYKPEYSSSFAVVLRHRKEDTVRWIPCVKTQNKADYI